MKDSRKYETTPVMKEPACGGKLPPCPKVNNVSFPELMRLGDGTPVTAAEQWNTRRREILALYRDYVYGAIPDASGEHLRYRISSGESGTELHITIERDGRKAAFTVRVFLPENHPAGMACFIEYCPFEWNGRPLSSANAPIAVSRGYAAIVYDPTAVAADNDQYTGAFYDLYPREEARGNQAGVLAAWAWGASKILDALEAGAGIELGTDPSLCMVAGVSRYGKSAAVAGAYDPRFRVTIPSCSGAGGVAAFRTDNHGKTYDLTSLGGSPAWENTSINEPFENLKGGEGYWFCPNFCKAENVNQLPVEQYMLCALAAGKNRHMIIITGITSEGWNNTEGQCLCYAASQPVWDLLGAGDQNNMIIHLDGHAILPSDMDCILDYCDVHLLGKKETKTDLSEMKGQLFLVHNRDRLGPEFDLFAGKKP